MLSALNQYCILLILFISTIFPGCTGTQPGNVRLSPPQAPPQACPSLGEISIQIDRKDYHGAGLSLSQCINEDKINSTYNEIFTDGYKFKFLIEALAAYSTEEKFNYLLKMRERAAVAPVTRQLFENYRELSSSNHNLFKEVMRCILTQNGSQLPAECLKRYRSAVEQSPVKAVYQQTFGNQSTFVIFGRSASQ